MFELEMASSTAGTLQLFYDRGRGVSTAESVAVPLQASVDPVVYRLPLPLGRYRLFRIDPNDRPGRYTIRGARIADAGGHDVRVIPLSELRAAAQSTIAARNSNDVVFDTPDAANDPQIVYEPQGHILLAPTSINPTRGALGALAAAFVIGLVFVWIDRAATVANVMRAAGAAIRRRPFRAAVISAVLGTMLAMYPLFLGRSLVSPGNGPAHVLYDQPPFAFGATDRGTEYGRGADVGAMMWAILPYTMVQREALAHGEFPLWNRYNTIGEPLWGQGQTFILDPTHLLSLLIDDPAVAMDVRFVVGRVVFAAGIGLTVAALTGNGLAAALSALLAPFAGHFTVRFNHPAYFSLMWAPWILLAYAQLASSQHRRTRLHAGAWLALATFLQMVGGTPKEGIVALGAAHLAGAINLLTMREPWRARLERLNAAALGSLAGVLMSAPHWLVFLETLGHSWTLYDQPGVQLAGRSHLLAYLLGGASPGNVLTGVHPLAVMGAVAALLAPRRLRGSLHDGAANSPLSPSAVGLAVAVMLVSALGFGLVPADVLMRLPLIANIHQIGISALGATVPLVLVLAGIGFAGMFADTEQGESPARAAVGAALALFLIAALLPLGLSAADLLALAVAGSALAAMLAATVVPRPVRVSTPLAFALAALVAIAPGGLHLETGILPLDNILIQPRPRADLDAASPAIAAIRAASKEPWRVAPVDAVLFPGTQSYWELEGIGGPDALRLPAVEALSDAAGVERTPWMWWTILRHEQSASVTKFLDMLGVRFLVSRPDLAPAGLSLLPTTGNDLVVALDRPSAWPRAFVVDRLLSHESLNEFSRILTNSNGPFASVDRHDLSAMAVAKRLDGVGHWKAASAYSLTPNSTSFRVETTGPAVAVLGEAWLDRDFSATLNGEEVPYFRVNHAFKGVRIPGAGQWDVRFAYEPHRWGLSWLLAAIGGVGLAALVVAKNLLN
ncbi:MAG: hypothetical protein IT178_12345 [Acidobacteria bacterium]|nr:hypothetical protein [Acidobacteriota bacterium]